MKVISKSYTASLREYDRYVYCKYIIVSNIIGSKGIYVHNVPSKDKRNDFAVGVWRIKLTK